MNIILRSFLSPGDILMLTAAVRDLQLSWPGQFRVDVRTSVQELWENNPYLSQLSESDADRVIDCEYPLIHQSNELPYHFIHGYRKHLAEQLRVPIRAGSFKGDVHLSEAEKSWVSQVEERFDYRGAFWLIMAGGKLDYTTKWWPFDRYQQVVDALKGEVQFVQVGDDKEHVHPPLRGVLDLRGQTGIRQLVRLVHHSSGVVCPVTFLMHLSAAVESYDQSRPLRPAVVVAGGREPPHWEAYPGHQYLHTIGALDCCATGGCWKARVHPLDRNTELDASLCERLRAGHPQCMMLITPEQVVGAVRLYLEEQA